MEQNKQDNETYKTYQNWTKENEIKYVFTNYAYARPQPLAVASMSIFHYLFVNHRALINTSKSLKYFIYPKDLLINHRSFKN